MLIFRFVGRLLCASVMVAGAGVVSGQDFPSKPIRMVTNEPGGGADLMARVIAQALSATVGQQVIVDNRGGGVVPGEIVAKAPPDGYTLLLNGSNLWLIQFLRDNVPYDPVQSFSPITLTTLVPTIVVVHPSVAARSVKDLIALAKARPGVLNYSSGATGTAAHIAAALFESMAGIRMTRVPYKSTGPALTALIGGEVQVMFPNAAAGMPHVNAGRLRALAVASAQASALAPGLPTVSASGVPGYESGSIYGVFAPARTPASLVTRLNQEIVKVLNRPDVKQKFFSAGAETVGSSPQQLTDKITSEMARLGKVIKDAGIRE